MSQTIATPPTVRLDSDVVGKPISRPEGAAKVSGAAKYAAEFGVTGSLWYGYVVSSPIAKGKITKIYADEVLALPGVRAWIDDALAEHDFVAFDEPYRTAP